jgi:hypothetical protein
MDLGGDEMQQAKNEKLQRVTILMRKGDLEKLRDLAAERGFLIPSGPGTGQGSVSHLIRALLDDLDDHAGGQDLDLDVEVSDMSAEEQVRRLGRLWEEISRLTEGVHKRYTAALDNSSDRQGDQRKATPGVWRAITPKTQE